MKDLIIAIDGPTGAGKTSLGTWLSKKLSYRFLETGLMYRALTVGVLANQFQDVGSIINLAHNSKIDFKILEDESIEIVMLDGRDITPELNTPQVDDYVSKIAAITEVRTIVTQKQKQIIQPGKIIVVGRDVGRYLAPNAILKYYLDADLEVRAERHFRELKNLGHKITYSQVLASLISRDNRDLQRKTTPLSQAEDAIVIDTTFLTKKLVREKVMADVYNLDLAYPLL